MSADNTATSTGVGEPQIDRSSTVYVVNKLAVPLTLIGKTSEHGSWDASFPPLATIEANSTAGPMVIKDAFGFNGSQGSLTYLIGSTSNSVVMSFACPNVADNWANIVLSPESATGVVVLAPSFSPNGPLEVHFTIVPGPTEV